jgi:hypothetical protein
MNSIMEIEKLKLPVNAIQKLSLARDIEAVTEVVRKAARISKNTPQI